MRSELNRSWCTQHDRAFVSKDFKCKTCLMFDSTLNMNACCCTISQFPCNQYLIIRRLLNDFMDVHQLDFRKLLCCDSREFCKVTQHVGKGVQIMSAYNSEQVPSYLPIK